MKSTKYYMEMIEKATAPKMVYVAGPYRNPDPCENTHNAMKAATVMLDSGKITPVLPHLSHFWHTSYPREEQTWLNHDMHLLARCDGLYRIAGDSEGADAEVAVAEALGMPVFLPGPSQYQHFMSWVRTGIVPG